MVRPRPRSLLIAALLAVGLGFLIERLVVTDTEAIEALLEEARDAAKDREWARLRPLLSDDFVWQGRNADETVAEVARLAERHGPTMIEVAWGAVAPARLRCDVEVDVRARVGLYHHGVRVRVTFAKEKDGWRMLEVQTLG
jgi:hypothetical protein